MKRSGGKQKQPNEKVLYGVLIVVVLGCVGFTYYEFEGPGTSAPPAAPVVTSVPAAAARPATTPGSATLPPGPGVKPAVAQTTGTLDPALHMEAMEVTESLEYAGSGRNIFSPESAPPPPKPIPAVMAEARPTVMAPPMPQGPALPPPPAPIDLKFFGTATTRDGKKSVFLLHGDDVYRAVEGDVVARKYKVITIGPRSIVMEDLSNNNRQTLPVEAQ